jgi:hypothetical protein
MVEYCRAFHAIEQQIYDMSFDDRLGTFLKPLPANCQLYIKLSERLITKDMEYVYGAARTWAHAHEDTRPQRTHGKPFKRVIERRDRSRGKGILAPTTPKPAESPGEDLDTLNRMATSSDQCFKCKQYGHFQNDCPRKDRDTKPNGGSWVKSTRKEWGGGRRFPSRKPSFCAMEQEDSDDDDDDDDDDGDDIIRETHYYHQSPNGYAEDLHSDDDGGDDYAYQEQPSALYGLD